MKDLLLKVLSAINSDKEVRRHFIYKNQKIGIMNWHNSAGNHLFDDHPEWFGITENEGNDIRHYFQTRSYNNLEHIKEMMDWNLLEEIPKDKRLIPDGHYCYSGSRDPGDKNYKPCPFWSMRKDSKGEPFGYCSFLEKGDNEFTSTMPVLKKGNPVTYVTDTWAGLLWDQVKECGSVKDDE